MSETEGYIWVITSPRGSVESQGPSNRGIREIKDLVTESAAKVPLGILKSSVENFVENLGEIISGLPELNFGYVIDEFEISAEVSGEGKIELVGGVKATASGGIKFRLKRASQGAGQ